MDFLERASEAIPKIQALARGFLDRIEPRIRGTVVSTEDSFGLMLLCYHSRFYEHAESGLHLQTHPDTALVARSALEGLWQLKWAEQDPVVRAYRWRMFAPVRDWRMQERLKMAGDPIDETRDQELAQLLREQGSLHLTRKASEAQLRTGILPSDPYMPSWHGQTVRALAEATGSLEEYLHIYSDFSDRHHWDFGDVITKLSIEGETLRWQSINHPQTVIALTTILSAYAEAAVLLDAHFEIGIAHEVPPFFEQIALASGIELGKA